MKTHCTLLAAFLILVTGTVPIRAGTIFYQAIPAVESSENSGISSENQYTSAIDGGNTRGDDRVINGITLFSLTASGKSATADNCTVNALDGNLSNAGGASDSIRADGVIKDAFSDMTFNNGASDNSQQEVVLDPQSLEAGVTYDLRVYICNSSGQNRQVNLAFVGDGKDAVETGFFNEDDARTSAGGFSDPNQTYYINYRYTWDGESTPGITITQKSGGAPFVLYALTNQLIPGGIAAAGGAVQTGGGGGEMAAAGGDQGLSMGLVEETDEVGVTSDTFYGSDSLNSNGSWIEIEGRKCWQPTNVSSGWAPYTNGTFQNCDDCGWTFVSEEPWAWACYHYGRWRKVHHGCGWAWVPGKVWAGAWVSWRQGKTDSCDCIGWAPLPPEAGCRIGTGISTWVDNTCDIGPDCYTFINIRDFGSSSYSRCNCIWDRRRTSTVIIDTWNTTNICHERWGTYCGGPDFRKCNEQIRRLGGRECEQIHVNRYDDPVKMGGQSWKKDGNHVALLSPKITGEKNPFHNPKSTANLGTDKIDHGWTDAKKDPALEKRLRNHIADESKGKNPQTQKAMLPPDAAQAIAKKQGGPGLHGQPGGATAAGAPGTMATGQGQQSGKGNKGVGAQNLTPGGQPGAAVGAGAAAGMMATGQGQHPGKGNKGVGAQNLTPPGGQPGATTGAGAAAGTTATGQGQHPGKGNKAVGTQNLTPGGQPGATTGAGAAAGTTATGQGQHPSKGNKAVGTQNLTPGGQPGATTGAGAAAGTTATGQGQHPGKGNKAVGTQDLTPGATTGAGGPAGTMATGQGQHPGKGNKGVGAQNLTPSGQPGATTGAGGPAGTMATGQGQHPGKGNKGVGAQSLTPSGQPGATTGAGGPAGTMATGQGQHPGKGNKGVGAQSLTPSGQPGATTGAGGPAGTMATGQGQHTGKGNKGVGAQNLTPSGGQPGATTGAGGPAGTMATGQGQHTGKGSKGAGPQSLTPGGQPGATSGAGGPAGTMATGQGHPKGKVPQGSNQAGPQGVAGQAATDQQQQMQQQKLQQQQVQQQKLQQQQVQQQKLQQQQVQQQKLQQQQVQQQKLQQQQVQQQKLQQQQQLQQQKVQQQQAAQQRGKPKPTPTPLPR